MGQVCQASISARKTYCSSGVIRMGGDSEVPLRFLWDRESGQGIQRTCISGGKVLGSVGG